MKQQTTSGLRVDLELTSICSDAVNHFDPNKPSLAFELSSQCEKCTTLVIQVSKLH